MPSFSVVSIIPLTGLHRSLSYKATTDLIHKGLTRGSLVKIPLGHRTELGLVEAINVKSEVPHARLRFIQSLEQPFPVVTNDLIKLADWIQKYYASELDAIFEIMIPGAVRKGMQIQQRKALQLKESLSPEALSDLAKRAPQQAKLYQFIAAQPASEKRTRQDILTQLKIAPSSAEALIKKGILQDDLLTVSRDAYMDGLAQGEQVEAREISLTEEQAACVASIRTALAKESFQRILLHGVTGSGKTEVYIEAMNTVLAAGGSVIYLVPEVALTPQTVSRLRARLENEANGPVVVWHSHLNDGERYDAWHAISTGKSRVVVGARSAVFAPLQNLRLIIVDEEHEPAYKQDESPRYHGRDVAVYRALINKAVCLLGSATPSLESLHNAQQGKYQLLQLTKRIDHRQLPTIHLVDMKRENAKAKGAAIFSVFLAELMRQRFEKGEQTILFLNRRGYDASVHCPDCGFVAMCDHCDLSLTHHRREKAIRCHLCGHEEPVPTICPKCRSPKIVYRGSGTQKIEDLAAKIIPGARVVRIDADTMGKKNLFREVLGDFRRGRIDILVGTQMIAKGLDFPNVTLVGLLDADISMHLPDFRAAERTFQLLVQVAGRAGRGDRAGEVVVQTSLPHAPPILYARQQDFHGFAEEELANRKEFNYPPFRHLIHHLFRGKNPEKVSFFAQQWVKHLEAEWLPLYPGIEIRGPAPCPIEKIKDHYRFQIWYFVPTITPIIGKLQELRKAFKWDRDVIEVLDVDAVGLI